jgi:hypothetical protein
MLNLNDVVDGELGPIMVLEIRYLSPVVGFTTPEPSMSVPTSKNRADMPTC